MRSFAITTNHALNSPPKKISKNFLQLLLTAIKDNEPDRIEELLSYPASISDNFPINDTNFHKTLASHFDRNPNPDIASHLLKRYQMHRPSLLSLFINNKHMVINRITARSWCSYFTHVNWETALQSLVQRKIHLFSAFIKYNLIFKEKTHLFCTESIRTHLQKSNSPLNTLIILCATPQTLATGVEQLLTQTNTWATKPSLSGDILHTTNLIGQLLSQRNNEPHNIRPFKELLQKFYTHHRRPIIRYLCTLFLHTHETGSANGCHAHYINALLARFEDRLSNIHTKPNHTSPTQYGVKKRKAANANSLETRFNQITFSTKKPKIAPRASP